MGKCQAARFPAPGAHARAAGHRMRRLRGVGLQMTSVGTDTREWIIAASRDQQVGARAADARGAWSGRMSDAMQIPLLERTLGGLLAGHAYLLHGVSGVGKTVLALQIARTWTSGGRRVLFLTTDTPESLLEQASLLGLSLQRDWERGDLLLCTYAPGIVGQVRMHGMRAFLDHLYEAGRAGTRGLIMDPVTPIFEAFSSSVEIDRDVRLLSHVLREWEWSTVFLADTGDLRQRPGLRESLGQHCSGVLELCTSRGRPNPAESPFLLRVERARQMTPSGSVVPYAIALEAGLIPVPVPSDDETANARAARPARVLMASSEKEEFEPLAKLLRRTMEVEMVPDGVAALARAATWGPDVLLLQADLPRLSGFSVCRALRQGRYTVPVVLVTGKGRRRSDRVRALLNGATDLVQAPFDLREVAARVRMASRMRVASLETGVEQHLLDVLTMKAQENVLEMPEFLEALGIALRAAARFSSPVSVVTFQFHPGGPEPAEGEAWSRFRQLLRQGVRSGDLVCHPDPWRAAALLCNENRDGAAAFAERLRRLALEEYGASLFTSGWWIDSGRLTIEGSTMVETDVRDLLAEAFEDAGPFLGTASEPGEYRMTGTDGE